MSARPLPVTATFPPPPLVPLDYVTPSSNLSLSRSNSTSSLLSVLNHNSYESLSPSTSHRSHVDSIINHDYADDRVTNSHLVDDANKNIPPDTKKNQPAKRNTDQQQRIVARPEIRQVRRSKSADASSYYKKNSRKVASVSNSIHKKENKEGSGKMDSFELESVTKEESEGSGGLSAWEQWIVRKAKEDRAKAEREFRKQKKLLEEEEKLHKQKEKKKTEIESVIQKWMKEYDSSKQRHKEMELRKSQEMEEKKKKEKEKVVEKAKEKFSEWVQQKAEEEARRKKELQEKKKKELIEKEEKRKKNEEAFNEWCQKTKSRPRTAPNSYGYTDGRLRGYYDSGAYPVPSYVNPVPWQPIEIPQYRPKKKPQTMTKRRRNSSRYF